VHERDQVRDDLEKATAVLEEVPHPDLGDGPHLPWYREWARRAGRVGALSATLSSLDSLLGDLDHVLQRGNELEEEAIEIARRKADIHEAHLVPALAVRVDGRNVDEERVEGVLVVEHKAGSPARNVVIETDWGDAPADTKILVAGEHTKARVSIQRKSWIGGSDPRPIRYVYEGPTGETATRDL
jgi:hypothetical protein